MVPQKRLGVTLRLPFPHLILLAKTAVPFPDALFDTSIQDCL
jgi:hypothetical protein